MDVGETGQLQATDQLNVVIVDDHVALRRSGLHVVGTADDAEQAEQLILRRRPDVALIDLALPGESGAALTRRLLELEPELRIMPARWGGGVRPEER
jgi:DNA-binding NarL/FixJ family response regulator